MTAWGDKSGNFNDAAQTVVALQPTFAHNGLAGMPVVRLDGADDLMDIADDASLDLTAMTAFAVFNHPVDGFAPCCVNAILMKNGNAPSGDQARYAFGSGKAGFGPVSGAGNAGFNVGGWADRIFGLDLISGRRRCIL